MKHIIQSIRSLASIISLIPLSLIFAYTLLVNIPMFLLGFLIVCEGWYQEKFIPTMNQQFVIGEWVNENLEIPPEKLGVDGWIAVLIIGIIAGFILNILLFLIDWILAKVRGFKSKKYTLVNIAFIVSITTICFYYSVSQDTKGHVCGEEFMAAWATGWVSSYLGFGIILLTNIVKKLDAWSQHHRNRSHG